MKQLDGFDSAIVGTIDVCGAPTRLAYNVEEILYVLQTQHGMSAEGAREYFEYNILGAYIGEDGPVYLTFVPYDEIEGIYEAENI